MTFPCESLGCREPASEGLVDPATGAHEVWCPFHHAYMAEIYRSRAARGRRKPAGAERELRDMGREAARAAERRAT